MVQSLLLEQREQKGAPHLQVDNTLLLCIDIRFFLSLVRKQEEEHYSRNLAKSQSQAYTPHCVLLVLYVSYKMILDIHFAFCLVWGDGGRALTWFILPIHYSLSILA